MNQTVSDSSKPTYRVIMLTHFGAKVSYIDKSSMDKNVSEPNDGSVPIADVCNARLTRNVLAWLFALFAKTMTTNHCRS